jgi:hypothetical protein
MNCTQAAVMTFRLAVTAAIVAAGSCYYQAHQLIVEHSILLAATSADAQAAATATAAAAAAAAGCTCSPSV